MILLLDMDGPLADFDGLCWQLIEANGWTLDIDQRSEQRHHYVTEHMPIKRERRDLRNQVDAAGWFESLPVTPGAIDGVTELLNSDVEVWVCTKPLEVNPTCRDGKAAWLREHLPMLEHRLILAPDKSLIQGDILLDDAPAPAWFPRATWKPVVFSLPYNGADSKWAPLPHWTWDDPIGDLLP